MNLQNLENETPAAGTENGEAAIPGSQEMSTVEQNAHNLVASTVERAEEIESLSKQIEEQQRFVEELRKNRNEILLDANLLEKKIAEERAFRDNATKMGDGIIKAAELIRKQLEAAGRNLDESLLQSNSVEKLREEKDGEKVAYMASAAEADNQCQLLLATADKARHKVKEERNKLTRDIAQQWEKLSEDKAEVDKMLLDLVASNQLVSADKAWLMKLGNSSSALETMAQLRKAVSVLVEKSKSLKKAKRQRDERVLKVKAEISKTSRDIDELKITADMWDSKIKINLENEDKLCAQLKKITTEMTETSDVSKGVKANLVAKTVLLVDLEEQKQQMTEVEAKLLEELSAGLEVDEQAKVAMEVELKEVETSTAKAEQECLLLEGRIFEIGQHASLISDELERKKEAVDKLVLQKKAFSEEVDRLQSEHAAKLIKESKLLENLEVELADLKRKKEETLKQEVNDRNVCKTTLEKMETMKTELKEKLRGNEIEEKSMIELESEVNKLMEENENHNRASEDLRFFVTQLQRYQIISEERRGLWKSGEEWQDKVKSEIERAEGEGWNSIQANQDNLNSLKEIARQREEEFRSLIQDMTSKSEVMDQNSEEILKLKQLLRECDATLAKETQEKQNLVEKLATKRRERDERAREDELRRTEQKKLEEEMKKREQKRRVQEAEKEAKAQEEARKAEAEKEAKRREEAKQNKGAAKKRQEENVKKTKKTNSQEDMSNVSWMALIKSQDQPTTIKKEIPDDYPPAPPTVANFPSGERKKFFKSRNMEPKRHPVYSPYTGKNGKKLVADKPKNVYDYESDSSIEVVYDGGSGGAPRGAKHPRKR